MPARSAKVADVPEIVDPAKRLDARGLLRRPPLERSEVVDVEVAAPFAGEGQRRTVGGLDPVERVECSRLQRHGSHTRFRLWDLQLAPGERASHVDNALLPIDVSSL